MYDGPLFTFVQFFLHSTYLLCHMVCCGCKTIWALNDAFPFNALSSRINMRCLKDRGGQFLNSLRRELWDQFKLFIQGSCAIYLDKTFNWVWGADAMFLMFLVLFQCFWLLFFDNNLFMDSSGKGDLSGRRMENQSITKGSFPLITYTYNT